MSKQKTIGAENRLNNLGQPKVFTDGITWLGGIPSPDVRPFTKREFESEPQKATDKCQPSQSKGQKP